VKRISRVSKKVNGGAAVATVGRASWGRTTRLVMLTP
jgi:hypothetical protein